MVLAHRKRAAPRSVSICKEDPNTADNATEKVRAHGKIKSRLVENYQWVVLHVMSQSQFAICKKQCGEEEYTMHMKKQL